MHGAAASAPITTGTTARSPRRVFAWLVLLDAITRGRERVLIGKRPCATTDEQPCLASAHAELRALARWLGHDERPIDAAARPGHHLLLLAAP